MPPVGPEAGVIRLHPAGFPGAAGRYTSRSGEVVEQTDYFVVNAWRALAEHAAESLHTGSRIVVSGRLQSRSWETEDHEKRSTVEVEAEEIAASMRFATVVITKESKSGPGDSNAASDEPAEGHTLEPLPA